MPGGLVLGAGVIGACVGAAAVYGYMQKRPEAPVATSIHQTPPQSGSGRLHPTYKYGIPIKERIREFSGHTVCFDPSTRNPAWVLERISKDDRPGDGKRAENFAEDKMIPERFRSKLLDYNRSGYDRGHMAPALNHKGSQQEMDDTFFLTNISPQTLIPEELVALCISVLVGNFEHCVIRMPVLRRAKLLYLDHYDVIQPFPFTAPSSANTSDQGTPQVGDGFNRDYWARFERWAKSASRKADELFIATGPVFAPKFTENGLRSDHGFIGNPPHAVAVPTHYFKVLLAEFSDDKGSKQVAVGAFAMPNRPIAWDTPLASFAVPLELLESLTGIEFFPRALSDSQRRSIDAAAADWRRLGMARQQALASEGSRQYLENLPGESKRDLVPANKLPSSAELSKVGTFSGPPAYRPRKTSGGGEVVHLCEKFWCDMKPDKYTR